MSTSHPFFEEVEWIAVEGVSTGCADGTCRRAAVVTRQAIVRPKTTPSSTVHGG